MREKIKLAILRFAVWIAVRRLSPPSITLIGDGALKNNFYSIRFSEPDGRNRFNVRRLIPQGYEGWWFNDGHNVGWETSLLTSAAGGFNVRFDHYYRGYIIDTKSAPLFVIKSLTLYPFFAVRWDGIKQFFYNRRSLIRKDRIQVLRLFVEKKTSTQDFDVGGTGIMKALYGKRWAGHPRYEPVLAYYHLLLDSLAEEGALKKGQHSTYSLAAKGLTILDRYEEDDRRHRDNIRIQWIIAAVTIGLLAAAASQIAVNIWAEIHPDPDIRRFD